MHEIAKRSLLTLLMLTSDLTGLQRSVTDNSGNIQMKFNMTLKGGANCTAQIHNKTSGEYKTAEGLFISIIEYIGDTVGLHVVGVDQLEFQCGSIIGSGRIQFPDNITEDAVQVSVKFGNVTHVRLTETDYDISAMTVSGYSTESSTSTVNSTVSSTTSAATTEPNQLGNESVTNAGTSSEAEGATTTSVPANISQATTELTQTGNESITNAVTSNQPEVTTRMPVSANTSEETAVSGFKGVNVVSLVESFNRSQATIRSHVSGFYNYTYEYSGCVQNNIWDGGYDMFDNGNHLYYQIDSEAEFPVEYNKLYGNASSPVTLLAATSHPFNAMMWVENDQRAATTFTLRVAGHHYDYGRGSVRTGNGSMKLGNFGLQFHFHSVYAGGAPSVNAVFYYVSNQVDWSSVPPTSFVRSVWSSATYYTNLAVQATGRPHRILMGYMLLSRPGGAEVLESEIRAVLHNTMQLVSTAGNIQMKFNMTLEGANCTAEIHNTTSGEYKTADGLFTSIIENIGGRVGLHVFDVDLLEFQCSGGSPSTIIGSGRIQFPNNITEDAVRVSEKFRNVTHVFFNRTQYFISAMTVSGYPNESTTSTEATTESNHLGVYVVSLVENFNRFQSTVRSHVSGFYNYTYDYSGCVQNNIAGGGYNMFDYGNYLYYQIDSEANIRVEYNKLYGNATSPVALLAATSRPFNAMMWVQNDDGAASTLTLRVAGYLGADGYGIVRTRNGSMNLGNFQLQFQSHCVYAAGVPSVNAIFYSVSNPVAWNSVPPTSFVRSTWSSTTYYYNYLAVQATGSPQRILMGYMLLSKHGGAEVLESEIRAVLHNTMEIVSTTGNIQMKFNMTLAGANCTAEIHNATSGDYRRAVGLFTSIIQYIGDRVGFHVVDVDQLEFHCGEIIGSAGRIQFPNNITETANQVSEKFKNVTHVSLNGADYEISAITLSAHIQLAVTCESVNDNTLTVSYSTIPAELTITSTLIQSYQITISRNGVEFNSSTRTIAEQRIVTFAELTPNTEYTIDVTMLPTAGAEVIVIPDTVNCVTTAHAHIEVIVTCGDYYFHSDTDLTVSYSTIPAELANNATLIQNYRITISQNGVEVNSLTKNTTDHRTATFFGLNAYTAYTINVTIEEAFGAEVVVIPGSVTCATLGSINVTCESSDDTALTVSYSTVPAEPATLVEGYGIYIRQNEYYYYHRSVYVGQDTDSYVFSALTANTTYTISVYVYGLRVAADPGTATCITAGNTHMKFSMTLAGANCTDEILDTTSGEYRNATIVYTSIIEYIGTAAGLPVDRVDQLEFQCGSITGSGRMQFSNYVTDNAAEITAKFNNVTQHIPVSGYVISTMTVSDIPNAATSNKPEVTTGTTPFANASKTTTASTHFDSSNAVTSNEPEVTTGMSPFVNTSKTTTVSTHFDLVLLNATCLSGTYSSLIVGYGMNPANYPYITGFRVNMSRNGVLEESLSKSADDLMASFDDLLHSTKYYFAITAILTSGSPGAVRPNPIKVECVTDDTCSVEQSVANYTFPPTQPGFVSYSEETCPNNENVNAVSIACTDGDFYNASTIRNSSCNSIEDILQEEYTNETLERLEFATAKVSTLNEELVEDVVDLLKNISDDEETVFTKEQISEATAIVAHLTEHYVETTVETTERATEKQDLVQSITKISRKLASENTPTITISKQNINVEVSDIGEEDDDADPSDYTFEASFYENKSTTIKSVKPAKISIPAETLNQARNEINTGLRIVSVAFRSSTLFPSNRTTEWVIATTLGSATKTLEGIQLDVPVEIEFNYIKEEAGVKRPNSFTKIITDLECVFWDFEIGDWSSKGCALLPGLPAICECDHLTNFAILVSRSEIAVDVALSVVTYIGSGLSIAGLIFTFIIICLSSNSRKRYQMQIIANICVCLAVALTMFVAGVDSQVDTLQCTIITTFLQYFFLTTWFWTGVYTYTIYRDIVQVMASLKSKFKIQFAACFAYGGPLVIVLLNAGITLGHIDGNDAGNKTLESSYRANNFCWLRHFSLYFGFLLPVALLLLFNVVVFCIVIPKISCKMAQIKSTKKKRTLRQHIATAVCLATTMGLSWIFGYVMLVSEDPSFLNAMSWLFTLTNSFQGVFIFYITAIRTGELRKAYAPVVGRFSTISVVSTGFSSVDDKSEAD